MLDLFILLHILVKHDTNEPQIYHCLVNQPDPTPTPIAGPCSVLKKNTPPIAKKDRY